MKGLGVTILGKGPVKFEVRFNTQVLDRGMIFEDLARQRPVCEEIFVFANIITDWKSNTNVET